MSDSPTGNTKGRRLFATMSWLAIVAAATAAAVLAVPRYRRNHRTV